MSFNKCFYVLHPVPIRKKKKSISESTHKKNGSNIKVTSTIKVPFTKGVSIFPQGQVIGGS